MKKFSFILVLIILLLSTGGITYYIKTQDRMDNNISVYDAFNSSGAKMVVNELYFFARATNEFNNLASLTQVCDAVFKELGIDKYSKNASSTDILKKNDLSGFTKDGVKISAMASIVGDKSGSGDKYITVDAIGSDVTNALDLRNRIEKAFKAYNLKPEINSCITGTYNGNLSDLQLEGVCKKVLDFSNAKKVESLRQENVISVSAFSPIIKDKLNIAGKNVNLSLAIRYNKLENKTYLWVATPVVNVEY